MAMIDAGKLKQQLEAGQIAAALMAMAQQASDKAALRGDQAQDVLLPQRSHQARGVSTRRPN